jgi:capsular polysaccharide biosynthesis protein
MEQQLNQQYNEEISIKELVLMVLNQKRLIFIITAIITLLAIIFAVVMKAPVTTTTTRIVLDFDSLSEGNNPDDTVFTFDQVISPSIIKSVIETNNLTSKINMTDLRKMIRVTPYIPYEITQLYEQKAAGTYTEEVIFYPTEYILSINTDWLSSINEKDAAVILESIISTYRTQFLDKYGKDVYFGNVSITDDLASYDYDEALQVIKSDLEHLKENADLKSEEAPNFRGINGLTFRELSDAVSLVLEVDYSRAEALTNMNNLTKDEQKLIKRYEFLIKNAELEYQKALAENTSVKAILATIDKPESIIIDDTELSSEEELLTKLLGAASGDDYYNGLVKQATESGELAANYLADKLYYQQEVAKFTNGLVQADDLAWAKKEVETDISLMHEFIVSTFNTFNVLNKDYRETSINDSIKITLQPSASRSIKTFVLLPIVGVILGLMFGCFIALMKEYWTAEPVVDKTRRLK